MLSVLSFIATVLGTLGIIFMLGCVWAEAMSRRKKPKEPRWRGEDSAN